MKFNICSEYTSNILYIKLSIRPLFNIKKTKYKFFNLSFKYFLYYANIQINFNICLGNWYYNCYISFCFRKNSMKYYGITIFLSLLKPYSVIILQCKREMALSYIGNIISFGMICWESISINLHRPIIISSLVVFFSEPITLCFFLLFFFNNIYINYTH